MSYPVRTTASLMADYILIAAFAGFCGFVIGVFFIVFALGDYRLSITAPQVAEVMEKTVQTHVIGDRNGEMRTRLVNWVDLQLVKDAGPAVKFGLSPSDVTFAKLAAGQRVLVRFNPSNPLSSVLDSEFNAGAFGGARSSLASWATITLMGSFFLIVWGRIKARRWIRTRDYGVVRNAVVAAHETSIWRGSKGTIGVSAVWRDETGRFGQTFWAQVRPRTPVEYLPPVGESIRVYVDAVTPNLSVWEGDVGTRPDPIESR